MDTWIRLLNLEEDGERNHTLYVIKARGMNHSNQVREYQITDNGIHLVEAYIGPDGVLTGTARMTQKAREQAATARRQPEAERRRRDLDRRRAVVARQGAELRASLENEEQEVLTLLGEAEAREGALEQDRAAIAERRDAAE